MDEHPGILNDDIAARFLVGLGHGDKAYQGLKNMVTWGEPAAGGRAAPALGAAAPAEMGQVC